VRGVVHTPARSGSGRDLPITDWEPTSTVGGHAWRRLKPNACWSGSRADHNRWVTRPCTRGESLWKNRRVAYRYAAVIDFNSLNPADLVAVLRWLRPGTRIARGPSRRLMR
jgi:L,D-peptidoglycan transpeptidase YkuD (ErfK/YbiS/YcfS/YnhG family)